MIWTNAFRALLLAQAGFTLGLIGLVIFAYLRVWRRVDKSRGLLPIHVVAVSVAHSMLIIAAVVEMYGRFGEPFSWRLPFLLVAMVVSDAALFTVMKLQVHRLRAADVDPHTVEVTLRADGQAETATIVEGNETELAPTPELVPAGELVEDVEQAVTTLRTVRSLVVSVLGLVLVTGLISVAVAFQVTRTNRMLDDGARVRAKLLDQVGTVERVVCDLEVQFPSDPPRDNCEDR